MITLEKVLEMASDAGFQLLAGAKNGSGYALGRKNSEPTIGTFQTLDEVMAFLTTQC